MAAAIALAMSSCNDFFELKPQNELVLEEFWQSEADVLSVTGSCYRAMQEESFMQRLLVWGEFRADNVIRGNDGNSDLNNISALNIFPSNGYAYWGDFYKVVNLCNTVEYFAPIAAGRDPNFTDNQLQGYIAEAKGIRALVYFTLVRTFRDIPFITEPVIDDTQSFQKAQSDPDEIIAWLIDDLKGIEGKAFTSWSNLAYTKGRMTQNAIRALIADMSLWLQRYDDCIAYCDKVLTDANNVVQLETSPSYARSLFVDGNSPESIFELQFSRTGSTVANYTVQNWYGTDGGSTPYFNSADFSETELFGKTDLRAYDSFYQASGTCPIKKYVAYRTEQNLDNVTSSSYQNLETQAANSNWIFYRLPDILLMKAEALIEQGTNLDEAYNLISRTFDRANPDLEPGSVNPEARGSQEAMRTLVFEERQREFLFEGKRYFDIIRMINRDRSQFSNIVSKYLIPKYSSLDQSTVTSKLSEYDALFMPIKDSELKANLELKQNPFYIKSTDIGVNK